MSTYNEKIREYIEENTVVLATNDWGYKVHACKLLDKATGKMAYAFYVQSPEGELSDREVVKRSKIIGKKAFDWLFDYDGDFCRDDITKVKSNFMQKEKDLKVMQSSSRVHFDLVYKDLCEYVEDNQIGDIISIKDNYCNIAATEFKNVIERIECDYKPLEVKKKLKELGLLRVNAGRAYDYNLTDEDGNQYKVISFMYMRSEEENAYVNG